MSLTRLLGIAKPMPGAAVPPELRIGGGERRDPDHAALEVGERAARVARVDRGARLDHERQRDAVSLRDARAERADDAVGHARAEPQRVADRDREVADGELARVRERRRRELRSRDAHDGEVVRREAADERGAVGVRTGRDGVRAAAGDDMVVRDHVAVRVEHDSRAEPVGALDLHDGRREPVHDVRDRAAGRPAPPPRAEGARGSSSAERCERKSRRRATPLRRPLRRRPRPRAARPTRDAGAAFAPYTEALGCYRPIPHLQSAHDDLLRHSPRARRRAVRQDGRLLQGQPERDRHRRSPRGHAIAARKARTGSRPSEQRTVRDRRRAHPGKFPDTDAPSE